MGDLVQDCKGIFVFLITLLVPSGDHSSMSRLVGMWQAFLLPVVPFCRYLRCFVLGFLICYRYRRRPIYLSPRHKEHGDSFLSVSSCSRILQTNIKRPISNLNDTLKKPTIRSKLRGVYGFLKVSFNST